MHSEKKNSDEQRRPGITKTSNPICRLCKTRASSEEVKGEEKERLGAESRDLGEGRRSSECGEKTSGSGEVNAG